MRDIPGFPGYKITKWGNVYSFHRGWHRGIGDEGKVVKWRISNGRAWVSLGNRSTSREKYKISRLVALTYIPNPNNLPIVMHLDNDPLNNYYKNLKWGTQSENIKQAYNEGRHHQNPKLGNDQKLLISQRYSAGGITQKQLAKEYGISQSIISKLLTNKTTTT